MRRNNHENLEANFNPSSILQKGMCIGLQKPVLFQRVCCLCQWCYILFKPPNNLLIKPKVETIVFPQLKAFFTLKYKQRTETVDCGEDKILDADKQV